MIIVHGTMPIKPEERDRAIDLARRMTEATRTEVGCVSYDFYVGLADPNTLLLFQEWETMDALMGHFQTSHMEDFLRDLPDVLNGEITTRRYAVQEVEEDEEIVDEEFVEPPPVIH